MMLLSRLKSGSDVRGTALANSPEEQIDLTDEAVDAIVRAFASGFQRKAAKAPLP